ncbi:hypothetical protein K439DRAFT_1264766, partial [Ramaria rubella]
PKGYHEAMSPPHSKQWKESVATEYSTLKRNKTFKWVKELPKGQSAVGSKIVFCLKMDSKGNVTKF